MSAARYMELLRTGRWFAALPAALQTALLRLAVVHTHAVGERLFSRGDAPSGLYAAIEGSVRIVGVTDAGAGKEVMLTLVEPPSWFAEIAVFDGEPRTHDAIAQTAVTVLRIPQAALHALLDAHPAWWRQLALLMSTKLRLMFATVEDTFALPLETRLARRLLLTAGAHGELTDRALRVVDVRQEQLATMLGTSRQTMNAALKDLVGQGILKVAYGTIEILDFAALRKVAE